MNLTIDQYILGFERSVRALPRILAEWDELDDELREAYSTQLAWLLDARLDVLNRAHEEGRLSDISFRLVEAVVNLLPIAQGLQDLMRIPADALLDYGTGTPASYGRPDPLRLVNVDACNDNAKRRNDEDCHMAIAA